MCVDALPVVLDMLHTHCTVRGSKSGRLRDCTGCRLTRSRMRASLARATRNNAEATVAAACGAICNTSTAIRIPNSVS